MIQSVAFTGSDLGAEGDPQGGSELSHPIAISFTVNGGQLAADLTVNPLGAGTDLRALVPFIGSYFELTVGRELATGTGEIAPDDGDRHSELNEDLLKRALDRETARTVAAKAPQGRPTPQTTPPWLGKNVAFQIRAPAVRLLEAEFHNGYNAALQAQAWANIPILNEWKRRYPQQDPLQVEEKYWQTRLVCPGGGTYVWNADFQTMESTVYGHPGQPKLPASVPLPFANASFINFGITFEDRGLRVRVVMDRNAAAN